MLAAIYDDDDVDPMDPTDSLREIADVVKDDLDRYRTEQLANKRKELQDNVEAVQAELETTYRKLLIVSKAYDSTRRSLAQEKAENERLEAAMLRMKHQVESVVHQSQEELRLATRYPSAVSLPRPSRTAGTVSIQEMYAMFPDTGMLKDEKAEIRGLDLTQARADRDEAQKQRRQHGRDEDGFFPRFADGSATTLDEPVLKSGSQLDEILSDLHEHMQRERERKNSPMRNRSPPNIQAQRRPARATRPG